MENINEIYDRKPIIKALEKAHAAIGDALEYAKGDASINGIIGALNTVPEQLTELTTVLLWMRRVCK